MKKLAVFDLDGTLCYTIEDIVISVNHALRQSGFPERSVAFIQSKVGNSVDYLIRHCVPENTDNDKCLRVIADYMDYYNIHSMDNVSVYPGVTEQLQLLKKEGVTLAVISNKPHRDSKAMTEKLFPSGLFSGVLGMMPRFPRKPNAEPLCFMMDYLGFVPEETVYFGDSEVDIAFAANSGVNCISCSWGYRKKEELITAGAKFLSDDIRDAVSIFHTL